MRKRRPNYRLVKIHRSYTVEEVARLFGTHKNTVRAWVKAGLPTCDSKRPTLVLGRDLAAYLQARRTKEQAALPARRNLLRAMPRAKAACRRHGGLPADYGESGEPDGHLPGLRRDDLPARQHGKAA